MGFKNYDTEGRPRTITDGLGTHTLSYATGGGLSADSLTGVTRSYTDGRLTGLTVGSDCTINYGYDTFGRFWSVTSQVAGQAAQSFTYDYLPNSDLLQHLTSSQGLTVTRAYEPQRDVLTQVTHQFGPDIISQYDYSNDALRRRDSIDHRRSGLCVAGIESAA